jgi:hypothetical protein
MSFIVGVKLSAALVGVTPALEIRTTVAATEMHERESNSWIGLCMMPPSNMYGIYELSGISKLQSSADTQVRRRERCHDGPQYTRLHEVLQRAMVIDWL